MKKWMKISMIVIGILILLFLLVGWLIGSYFFDLALNPNSDKSIVLGADHNQMSSGVDVDPEVAKQYKDNQKWFDESGYQDLYIDSDDGLKLHANYIENKTKTDKLVIIFHGYGGKGKYMISSAIRFYNMGYNVLLPDARGLGESEGDYIGMGWHERLDALKWINHFVEQNNDTQIALYGVSMGGATVMMISGEDLPQNVKVIVEDCGYTSVWDEFSYQLNAIFKLPTFPVMNFASIVTNIKAGYTLEEADAVKQVAKSKTPMMFIHGDSDTFVPSYMINEVYEAANVPKEKIVVQGAGHGEASSILGEEYWNAIQVFINKYM